MAEQAGATSDAPEMEEILASIRRILHEDEAVALNGGAPLDEPDTPSPAAPPAPATEDPAPLFDASPSLETPEAASEADPIEPEPFQLTADMMVADHDSAEDRTTVVDAMAGRAGMRPEVPPRGLAVHRGGPTVEQIAIEESRRALRAWLNDNLPRMVDALVSEEISRIAGRSE